MNVANIVKVGGGKVLKVHMDNRNSINNKILINKFGDDTMSDSRDFSYPARFSSL